MAFPGRSVCWIGAALLGLVMGFGAGGCQSSKPWSAVVPAVPKFSCDRFARWWKSPTEEKKFREQVAADPFPHASQLGLGSGGTNRSSYSVR